MTTLLPVAEADNVPCDRSRTKVRAAWRRVDLRREPRFTGEGGRRKSGGGRGAASDAPRESPVVPVRTVVPVSDQIGVQR